MKRLIMHYIRRPQLVMSGEINLPILITCFLFELFLYARAAFLRCLFFLSVRRLFLIGPFFAWNNRIGFS
jgi:hypothetical protein